MKRGNVIWLKGELVKLTMVIGYYIDCYLELKNLATFTIQQSPIQL